MGVKQSLVDLITVRKEVAKVMFLQVSVCPQAGEVSQHALQVVSHHALQEVSRGDLLLGGMSGPGRAVSQHALRQNPLGETATAVDGTHPTGMHSC